MNQTYCTLAELFRLYIAFPPPQKMAKEDYAAERELAKLAVCLHAGTTGQGKDGEKC